MQKTTIDSEPAEINIIQSLTFIFCMMIIFITATLDSTVDDKEIFTIVGPAFQTIVGGFIGLITGINIAKKEEENKDDSTVA